MNRHVAHWFTTLFVLLGAQFACAEVKLSSPGFSPSKVTNDGALVEPWGTVRLQIVEPQGGKVTSHRAEQSPMPVAVTCMQAGPVTLTQSAYRAPIWPAGVDVLEAVLANPGEAPAKVQLEVVCPKGTEQGESVASVKGQVALTLPASLNPVREEREWGCLGGVRAMQGWAKPNTTCDPAFRNISAGMGGVAIVYRFAVEPGAKRKVVLGFCESYHPQAGRRPLVARVEGTQEQAIDPIAVWGRHVPGVVPFDAVDADRNGRLEVTVAPHPEASDHNPILNVLWVFAAGTEVDANELIAGKLNDRAQHYVDVGGKNDQGLYKPGNLKYVLQLEPKEERAFFFLAASPGCRSLPDPALGLWNRTTLRKAAAVRTMIAVSAATRACPRTSCGPVGSCRLAARPRFTTPIVASYPQGTARAAAL